MKKIRIWHVLNLLGFVFVAPLAYMLMTWLVTGTLFEGMEVIRGLVAALVGVIIWLLSDGSRSNSSGN